MILLTTDYLIHGHSRIFETHIPSKRFFRVFFLKDVMNFSQLECIESKGNQKVGLICVRLVFTQFDPKGTRAKFKTQGLKPVIQCVWNTVPVYFRIYVLFFNILVSFALLLFGWILITLMVAKRDI